jgi:glutamate/tyrosine decarboxylase-like PLP-dependent enzyme
MRNNKVKEKLLLESAFQYGMEYKDKRADGRVVPNAESRALLDHFDEKLPAWRSNPMEVIDMLKLYGEPNTVAQTGGRYFGFVNGATFPVGLAARIMADFWDQNSALEVMSPLVSRLETVVEKWLIELFDLPQNTAASFVSGTSMASFCGLAAARWRLSKSHQWDISKQGMYGAPPLKIVMGEAGHASVIKALHLLGFGDQQITRVPCDSQGRIKAEELPPLDDRTILILQAGNVNSGAFDSFDAICSKANKFKAWVHIDGAFGLWAAGVDKFTHLTAGINKADSWSVDAHKTLNSPYDSGILLCRDKEALLNAMYASGAYIVAGQHRDGMYYTPEMSRCSRIIELWAILKYLGREGITQLVNQMHQQAIKLGRDLHAQGFEVLNEIVFNQLMVRYRDDATTGAILTAVQADGTCWCGPSIWHNKKVIRISVCSWRTDREDIDKTVAAFAGAKKRVLQKG